MALRVTGYLGLDGSGFFSTLNRARGAVMSAAASMTSRFAAIFSIGAIGIAARKTTEFAGRMVDLSARTGRSVESLQRLSRAAKENGAEVDVLIAFWDKLNRARSEALKDPKSGQAKAFKSLGISDADLKEKSADDLSRTIATKVQTSANIEPLMAALFEVGGKGVGQLIPLFRAGLDQMYQDMSVMTTEQALVLDELDDAFSSLSDTISIMLAPWLVKTIQYLQEVVIFWKSFASGIGAVIAILKGGTDSRSAAEAFQQEFDKTLTGMFKSAEDASKSRRERKLAGPLNFSPFDPKEAKPTKQTAADSLVTVGNFLGSGSQLTSLTNQILNVNREHLAVSKEIRRNLTKAPGVSTVEW